MSIGHGDNVNRGITPERKSGQEEFEDTCTNEVIKIGISKKNRQHNGQKKNYKLQLTKHTHEAKDRVTRTPLKTEGELGYSGRVSSSCSTSGTHLESNLVFSLWSCTLCRNFRLFLLKGNELLSVMYGGTWAKTV